VEIANGKSYYGPFPDHQDIEVKLPGTTVTNQIKIVGGRNLRLIGGHIAPEDGVRFCLRIVDITGSAFFEGLLIDAKNLTGDGINVSGKKGFAPEVYLQNVRVLNINGFAAGEHALIASHEQVGLGEHGTGQHPLFVSIHQAQLKGLGWTGAYRVLAQERLDGVDLLRGQATLAAEHVTQLSQHHLAGDQGVLGEHQAQQIGADSTRQKGTHQHVGVEENEHVVSRDRRKHVVIREPAGCLPKGQSLAP
jgi:hypothetical protein